MSTFRSVALDDIPAPDFCDMVAIPLPPGATLDPTRWAEEIFSPRNGPFWVKAAFGIRQAIAPLIGVPRAEENVLSIVRVEGNEALIAVDDKHLDFRAGVAVDEVAQLVRVTTTVRLRGRRGRLYFAPVSVGHGPVVLAMMKSAAARLAEEMLAID